MTKQIKKDSQTKKAKADDSKKKKQEVAVAGGTKLSDDELEGVVGGLINMPGDPDEGGEILIP